MKKNIILILLILLILAITGITITYQNLVKIENTRDEIPPKGKMYRSVAYVAKPADISTAIEGLEMYKNYDYGTALISIPIDNKFDTNEPTCDLTDKQLNQVIDVAQAQGLEVVLKCHNVSIYEDGQGNRDQPTDPKKWFENYKVIVDRIADIAVSRGHDKLIISNEMHNVLNISQWREYFIPIIDSVKRKGLQVSCSTNIPEIRENDGFQYWDELDFFSVNTYPQLTNKGKEWAIKNPKKIKDNFYKPISNMDVNYGELFEKLGGPNNLHKDIWITEIGCIPATEGLLYPAYWGSNQIKDEEVQKIYMEAVLDVLENDQESGRLTNRIKKYVIWDGNSDSDFNVIGKAGQPILEKYWK